MSTEGQSQRASGVRNHVIFSLCVIATCLQIMTLPPGQEQGAQILLWFNLAIGYVLAMASILVPNTKMKEAAAKLNVVSAAFSLVLLMIGELTRTSP